MRLLVFLVVALTILMACVGIVSPLLVIVLNEGVLSLQIVIYIVVLMGPHFAALRSDAEILI